MTDNQSLDVTRQFRLFYEVVRGCETRLTQLGAKSDYDAIKTVPSDTNVDVASSKPSKDLATEPIPDGQRRISKEEETVAELAGELIAELEVRGKDFSLYGGEYGARLYQRVIYVFAAFADEIMLASKWNGRDIWLKNPLEVRLFGSQSAGDDIFSDIENGLADYEIGKRDLARTYLMALNLGFKGRYKDTPSEEIINSHKSALFLLINDRDASREEAGKSFLGNVYQYNQTGGAPKLMPYLRPWLISIASVVVLYVIASHLIWTSKVSNLEAYVQSLITQLSP